MQRIPSLAPHLPRRSPGAQLFIVSSGPLVPHHQARRLRLYYAPGGKKLRIGIHDTHPPNPPHVVFGLLAVKIRGENKQERGDSLTTQQTEDEVATEGFHPFPKGVDSYIREASSTQAQAWKWYGKAVQ